MVKFSEVLFIKSNVLAKSLYQSVFPCSDWSWLQAAMDVKIDKYWPIPIKKARIHESLKLTIW